MPSDTIYIGRPGPYGNQHAIKDGIHTREESVSLNRIDIYHQIHDDPSVIHRLHVEMDDKNLACWCASKTKTVSCHGDNYLHILSPELADRDWTKSVTVQLIDDLRRILVKLHTLAMVDATFDEFLPAYFKWDETKLQIEHLVALMKRENWNTEEAHYVLACVVTDLELMLRESTKEGQAYRLNHAHWIMDTIFNKWQNRIYEPVPPNPAISKPDRKKKS